LFADEKDIIFDFFDFFDPVKASKHFVALSTKATFKNLVRNARKNSKVP
jgi:hypothetical protein